jgi:hypothetical protein
MILFYLDSGAQLVEVRANYNGIGNVDFSAHNNAKTPLFLNIDFADLQNTSFRETLPYIKRLEPGFNSLFTLERYGNAGPPRFNYKIRYFRSNPKAIVNFRFPYLIPFMPGTEVRVFDVKNIDGFWGADSPKSWFATGFITSPGIPVFASRTGQVVEIASQERNNDPVLWYHGWRNSVTILQPDGSLICYRNIVADEKKLKLNQKVFAGQELGTTTANELVVMIYHHSLSQDRELMFIIPEFSVTVGKSAILNSSQTYGVIHPAEVIGRELTAKERKKHMGL